MNCGRAQAARAGRRQPVHEVGGVRPAPRHRAERLAAEVEVEAGDDDRPVLVAQRGQSVDGVAGQELRLVDARPAALAPRSRAPPSPRRRRIRPAGVADEIGRIAGVAHRLERDSLEPQLPRACQRSISRPVFPLNMGPQITSRESRHAGLRSTSARRASRSRRGSPGFYPREAKPDEFLRRYAERLPSVELNTTGYRLPSEQSFRRWAEQTPPTAFASPSSSRATSPASSACSSERVTLLGERLGVVRVVAEPGGRPGLPDAAVRLARPGAPARVRLPPRLVGGRRAAARRRGSTTGRPTRRSATSASASRRTRTPTSSASPTRIRPLLDAGVDVYAYFRHEDEPTAPHYAEQLLGLLRLPHP